jgi:hypothetical protein
MTITDIYDLCVVECDHAGNGVRRIWKLKESVNGVDQAFPDQNPYHLFNSKEKA